MVPEKQMKNHPRNCENYKQKKYILVSNECIQSKPRKLKISTTITKNLYYTMESYRTTHTLWHTNRHLNEFTIKKTLC